MTKVDLYACYNCGRITPHAHCNHCPTIKEGEWIRHADLTTLLEWAVTELEASDEDSIMLLHPDDSYHRLYIDDKGDVAMTHGTWDDEEEFDFDLLWHLCDLEAVK